MLIDGARHWRPLIAQADKSDLHIEGAMRIGLLRCGRHGGRRQTPTRGDDHGRATISRPVPSIPRHTAHQSAGVACPIRDARYLPTGRLRYERTLTRPDPMRSMDQRSEALDWPMPLEERLLECRQLSRDSPEIQPYGRHPSSFGYSLSSKHRLYRAPSRCSLANVRIYDTSRNEG